MRAEQIGLQLYTVREEAGCDFLGTLRRLGELGYRAVELAGYHGVPVAEVRATLDGLGMRALGAHVAFARFEAEPDVVLGELRTLGCEFAVVPSLPPEWREGVDAARVRGLGERFNAWGERCRAAGLRFGYHNHAFEFVPLADDARTTFYDALVAATDPALVAFELDVFWAAHAGHDPLDLIPRLGSRAPLLHVKDQPAAGDDRPDAPVGEGVLPWPAILAAGEAAGVEWYIVEQDHPRDALADVRTSLRNLEGLAVETAPRRPAATKEPGGAGG